MNIACRQRAYRAEGHLQSAPSRLALIDRLSTAFREAQDDLLEALARDTGKSRYEAMMTEIVPVAEELRYFRKHLARLMRPQRVPMDSVSFPGRKYILRKPHGGCILYAPWNYPVNLMLIPLIGAISGGNSAICKPSSKVPHVNAVLRRVVSQLPEGAVYWAEEISHETLASWPADFLFFTGSQRVGRRMACLAAEKQIPAVLELGGKSPVLVLDDAKIDQAARRILWGKSLNSGQTCVAPDYVLADAKIFSALVEALRAGVRDLPPLECRARIITEEKYRSLLAHVPPDMRRAPFALDASRRLDICVRDDVDAAHPLLQEEIFGPILPVLPYRDLKEAIEFVESRPSPLALYVFTPSRARALEIMERLPFGGGAINDTVLHIAAAGLPFGGIGASGYGRYHGEASWRCFTVPCGVYEGGRWENPVRLWPWTTAKERILRWLSRRG